MRWGEGDGDGKGLEEMSIEGVRWGLGVRGSRRLRGLRPLRKFSHADKY